MNGGHAIQLRFNTWDSVVRIGPLISNYGSRFPTTVSTICVSRCQSSFVLFLGVLYDLSTFSFLNGGGVVVGVGAGDVPKVAVPELVRATTSQVSGDGQSSDLDPLRRDVLLSGLIFQ